MTGSEGGGAIPSSGEESIPAVDDLHIRAFLIADVRGWTVFTQEHGDEGAGKLAAKFARLVREVVEGRGGKLLELRGDEAMCVFGSPRQAIRAAADLQERFVEETLADPELPLTVGIGLDAGEAVEVEGGYRGGALNLAARLCSQAVAGEILASREVAHLARRVEGVTYQDRGSISLKGLSEPVGFVRVVPDGVDLIERLGPYAPVRPAEPRRPRRPPWPAIVAAALVVILIAAGLPFLLGDDEIVPEANSVARVDPADGSINLATHLDARPGAAAAGFDSIWVVHPDRGFVSRLDATDGEVKDTIQVGGAPTGIAIGEGSVWVTNTSDGTVSRISPATNEETQQYEVGSGPSGIAFGGGALWVADSVANELVRVTVASGQSRTVALPAGPTAVHFTPDGVWVTSAGAATVTRVDPDSLEVTVQVPVGNGPASVVSAFGSIWVANRLDGNVSRVEPSTGQILATVPVGDGPNSVVEAAGQVWVANEFTNDIVSLDPATDPIGLRERVHVGAVVGSLVSTPDGVWVSVGASATSHRGGTLRLVTPDFVDSLDPGVAYGPEWSALSLTNDGLIAYRKTGGAEGLDLVPDLATALPDVSADGLRYRFPLRNGVRYSTGDPVIPEDFRYGLERAIKLSPAAASLFSALAGALECHEQPDTCDLAESIVTDADAVTFHLAVPDPDLPFKLALPFASPVPVGTPIEDQGVVPVPATGPYVITDASRKHLVLERNPFFEEWSPAAQPDGFVDRIEWAIRPESGVPLHDVARGETDATWGHPPPDAIAELRTAHPDQLIQVADPAAYYWLFDLATAPFDDARVRRAINLAVDRTRVQELLGGESVWRVSCQILPPNFPGYEPYCPYTVNPGAAWTGADLDEARRLIEEAGAVGAPVTIRASGEFFFPDTTKVARYLEDLLDRLGFEATLDFSADIDSYFPSIEPKVRRGVQMFEYIWFPDFPAASGFISLLYRCGAAVNLQPFCDREFDRAITDAQRLAATDPAAANEAWAELDRELVDRAITLPLVNSVRSYAFSDRVGNAQINPQFGLLLSRLWVQ